MNCTQTLPEGYREILSLDLQHDKKTALKVHGLAFLLCAAVLLLGVRFASPLIILEHLSDFRTYLLHAGALLAGMVLYMVLHELTHAAVMKAYRARQLRFGFTGVYAFAGSEADYFGRRAYLRIALAPLLVWLLLFSLLCALVPRDWFWVAWYLQALNVSGSAGDLYVAGRISRMPAEILVRDTGLSMTVYGPAQ